MRERFAKKTMPSKALMKILTAVGSICTQNFASDCIGHHRSRRSRHCTCAAADSGKKSWTS